MVNEFQAETRSTEIPMSRVFDIERQKLGELLHAVVNENARLQASNEAIVSHARELEAELASVKEQRDRLAESNDRLAAQVGSEQRAYAVLAEEYDRRLLNAGEMSREDFESLHPPKEPTEDGGDEPGEGDPRPAP